MVRLCNVLDFPVEIDFPFEIGFLISAGLEFRALLEVKKRDLQNTNVSFNPKR